MILRSSCLPLLLRRRAAVAGLALLLTTAIYALWNTSDLPCCSALLPAWSPSRDGPAPPPPSSLSLSLPELDDPPPRPAGPDAASCARWFTTAYLEDLRDHAIEYCAPTAPTVPTGATVPASRLTCFHTHVRGGAKADSLCFGTGAVFDAEQKRFRLDCPAPRTPTAAEVARQLIPLAEMRPSSFDTGPKAVLDHFVTLNDDDDDGGGSGGKEKAEAPTTRPRRAPTTGADVRSFVILVKREGNMNLWHNLMEIWSMMLSMDVLRMTRGSLDGAAAPVYRYPEDAENTHVVLLDDSADAVTVDLWRFFSRHPILRLRDMVADPARVPAALQSGATIVLPLAGGSNPLWMNDWTARGPGCGPDAVPLLQLLVRRVFAHAGVPLAVGPPVGVPTGAAGAGPLRPPPIRVTFVERHGTRQLLGAAALLAALQAAHPEAEVRSVDMAGLTLAEQLRVAQATDVLVGVHGAGLTHALFMRAGAGAVVEIQPAGLHHKGFRNLAAMTGHGYFGAEATIVAAEKAGGKTTADPPHWQSSNVRIEEARFLALLDAAIKSVYNEGLRNLDVV